MATQSARDRFSDLSGSRMSGPAPAVAGPVRHLVEPLAAGTQLIADRLDREDPAAAELASLCAFLAPEPIPQDLFTSAPGELAGGLADRAADPLAWRLTLAHLAGQSLWQSPGPDRRAWAGDAPGHPGHPSRPPARGPAVAVQRRLIERRDRSVDAGVTQLSEAAGGIADPERAIAAALRALGSAGPQDDTCLVALRVL
jgi:hypothetical protein